MKENKFKPEWMVDAHSLEPTDHLEVQVAIQKLVDNAASKTINCPSDMTTNKLSKILLEYLIDLKGITIYVDGSKGDQPLSPMTFNEIKKYMKDNEIDSDMNDEDVQCVSGACDI